MVMFHRVPVFGLPMVCDACNIFHSCEQSRDTTSLANAVVRRLFDIDLWFSFVGAAHFVTFFASFQVPYRVGRKQNCRCRRGCPSFLLVRLVAATGHTPSKMAFEQAVITPHDQAHPL
jgi:hypothetical protein